METHSSKVEISGKIFEVSAIASTENSITYLKNIDSGVSPKSAFYAYAYAMHSEAQKKNPKTTTRHIFNTMNDNEALEIMRIIVSTNTDAPLELWKLDIQDIYERFEVYIREYVYLSTREIVKSINNLVDTMKKQIVSSCTLGLQEFREKLVDISSNMVTTINSSLVGLKEAVAKYCDSRTELDPVMSEFGWGGLSAIPGNIIQYINAKKSILSADEVNRLIFNYYERKNYEELEIVVSSWWWNPYFSSRKQAIVEALKCFKQKLNIASLTLLTLHFDGIVKEFLFFEFGIKLRKNEKAVEEISKLMVSIKDESISYFYDCNVKAVDEIGKRLTETFEIEKIDETSNLSRHKIAHGHMYDDVSTDVVLKTFLWMNELENLFSTILKNKSNSQSKD